MLPHTCLPSSLPIPAQMLQIGDPGGLTVGEARVHFATWAMTSSLLLIGAPLNNIDSASLGILKTPGIVAVSQDRGGSRQGGRVSAPNLQGPECWAKHMSDGSAAVVLINRGAEGVSNVTCTW